MLPGSIQRVSLDGRVETVATDVDGVPLRMPNDLAFGPDGRLYFTDPGLWDLESRPDPGRLIALKIHPQGATYVAQSEEILKGRPLNVVDGEVGPDGAFYFATGGRGTQGGVYRPGGAGHPPRPAARGGPRAPGARRRGARGSRPGGGGAAPGGGGGGGAPPGPQQAPGPRARRGARHTGAALPRPGVMPAVMTGIKRKQFPCTPL